MSLENNKIKYGGIVQLIEQRTVNPWVVGLSPTATANFNNVDSLIFKIEYRRLQQIIEYKKD